MFFQKSGREPLFFLVKGQSLLFFLGQKVKSYLITGTCPKREQLQEEEEGKQGPSYWASGPEALPLFNESIDIKSGL